LILCIFNGLALEIVRTFRNVLELNTDDDALELNNGSVGCLIAKIIRKMAPKIQESFGNKFSFEDDFDKKEDNFD
jgi:hypothetical protein